MQTYLWKLQVTTAQVMVAHCLWLARHVLCKCAGRTPGSDVRAEGAMRRYGTSEGLVEQFGG